MKKGFLSLFVLAFFFTFNLSVLAEGGHDEDKADTTEVTETETDAQSEKSDSHSDEEEDHAKEAESHAKEAEGHSKEAEEHSKMSNSHSEKEDNHSEEKDTHSYEAEEEAHEDEADDGHHGPVIETPPNYKVLGTYGAVNLSFILIGIWNKWFRRKGK